MENNVDLSVVIPAYNEAENLRELLPRMNAALKREGIAFEILVVDRTTKTDDTPEICAGSEAGYLNRQNSDLFGNAVRTGIKFCKGRYVL